MKFYCPECQVWLDREQLWKEGQEWWQKFHCENCDTLVFDCKIMMNNRQGIIIDDCDRCKVRFPCWTGAFRIDIAV